MRAPPHHPQHTSPVESERYQRSMRATGLAAGLAAGHAAGDGVSEAPRRPLHRARRSPTAGGSPADGPRAPATRVAAPGAHGTHPQ